MNVHFRTVNDVEFRCFTRGFLYLVKYLNKGQLLIPLNEYSLETGIRNGLKTVQSPGMFNTQINATLSCLVILWYIVLNSTASDIKLCHPY